MMPVLILPYFGKLPPYFDFFLRSLAGKKLEVLFFSDLEIGEYPENFKPVRLTFDEFKALAEEKLGMRVKLASPRRLCDFKPMYGRIFEDYIRDYEYWAFGDCDLVYGRLFSRYIDDAVKSACDLFTLHESYVAGPFCMIRNSRRMNDLWKSADNWREVVSFPEGKCLAFDELHGDWHQALSSGNMTIERCRELGDSFTAVVRRTPGLKLRMQECISEKALCRDVVRMRGDRLFRNDQEVACFHYVCSKLRKYFTYVRVPYGEIVDYVIDDTGFYPTRTTQLFRPVIALTRKTRAAVNSILENGISRVWR